MSVSPGAAVAGAALPRPVPPPPRLTCVEENTVRQIKSYVDGPRLRRGKILFWRLGRVRSYVRPFRAAHMAAGPDEVRGLGLNQSDAVITACRAARGPNPRFDRLASRCLITLAKLG